MSENSWNEWYEKKKAAGLCITCGTADAGEFSRCRPCREKRQKQRKNWKHQRHTHCVDCGISAHGYRCRECWDLMRRKYAKTAAERRELIFSLYGDVCACCGEANKKFLSLDHINNDGYKERTRGRICTEKRDDLRILCMNCNWGRARNEGTCPHEQQKSIDKPPVL